MRLIELKITEELKENVIFTVKIERVVGFFWSRKKTIDELECIYTQNGQMDVIETGRPLFYDYIDLNNMIERLLRERKNYPFNH